jgi:hypothetical protein
LHHHALPSLDRLYELFSPNFAQGELIMRTQRGSRKAGEIAGFLTYDGRYLMLGIDYKVYLLHRVMYAMHHRKDPGDMEIDHIDGDTSNNRADNLRLATRAQNGQNTRRRRKGLKGAYLSFKGQNKPWMSTINREGVRHYLGSFYTEKEAHEAYITASAIHHGEFGRAY